MRQQRHWWRLPAVLLGLAIVAAACGSDNNKKSEASGGSGGKCPSDMQIGFFGALTGDSANLGINIRNGAELAIDQWNSDNPDCKVTLKEYDSQGDPAQAPGLAQKAAEDKNVVAIVGPAFSGESAQANPIFDQAGLPIVTASATNPDLSKQGWKIFHRALANDAAQGPAVGKYILDQLKGKKVAVIDDASDYGKGLADIVRSTVKDNGGSVSTSESIDPKAQDYSATVNKIAADKPDTVFFGGYYQQAGLLVKQLRDAGVTAQFVSGDGSLDPGFVKAAGATAANGSVITCPCAPSPADFQSAYKAKFNKDPGTYSPEAYDSANIVLQAIKAGKYSRKDINTYVSGIDYKGITKDFKFSPQGEVEAITIYAYPIAGGKIGLGKPTS